MQTDLIRDPDALRNLQAVWNHSLSASATNTVFQRLEWITSWWDAFAEARRLCVVTVRDGETLLGAAPLCVQRRRLYGLPETICSFIGADNYASDYCDLIAPHDRPQVLTELLAAVDRLEDWTILDLFNLPSASPTRSVIENFFRARGLFVLSHVLYDAPACLLDAQSAADLLSRKSLKRHLGYFQRRGTVECLHLSRAEEIRPWLPAFFEQHRRRWQTSGSSIFKHPEQCAFYERFIERLPPEAGLLFTVVLCDGAPIAFHLGFVSENRFFWYKPSFDITLRQHSPGEALLRLLFEYAINHGLAEFDFTVGSEPFKYRFANHIRTNHRIRIYRRRSSYLLERARLGAGKVKRAVLPIGRSR